MLLTADATRRHAIVEADGLRAEQKALGRQVGKASGEKKAALLARGKEPPSRSKRLSPGRTRRASRRRRRIARSPTSLPMMPRQAARTTLVLEHVGEPRRIDDRKDHLELGESLGLIDMKRGTKVSGSRFYFLTGPVRCCSSACSTWPPEGRRRQRFHPHDPAGAGAARGDGGHRFPRRAFGRDLPPARRRPVPVGTSRVPLAGYHMDEDPTCPTGRSGTPGWSSCFRREAGSYGKDTRGIIRCTSSTRSRASSTLQNPRRPRPNTASLLGWERRCSPRSTCRTG